MKKRKKKTSVCIHWVGLVWTYMIIHESRSHRTGITLQWLPAIKSSHGIYKKTHSPNQPTFMCLAVLYNMIPITAQQHFALTDLWLTETQQRAGRLSTFVLWLHAVVFYSRDQMELKEQCDRFGRAGRWGDWQRPFACELSTRAAVQSGKTRNL